MPFVSGLGDLRGTAGQSHRKQRVPSWNRRRALRSRRIGPCIDQSSQSPVMRTRRIYTCEPGSPPFFPPPPKSKLMTRGSTNDGVKTLAVHKSMLPRGKPALGNLVYHELFVTGALLSPYDDISFPSLFPGRVTRRRGGERKKKKKEDKRKSPSKSSRTPALRTTLGAAPSHVVRFTRDHTQFNSGSLARSCLSGALGDRIGRLFLVRRGVDSPMCLSCASVRNV